MTFGKNNTLLHWFRLHGKYFCFSQCDLPENSMLNAMIRQKIIAEKDDETGAFILDDKEITLETFEFIAEYINCRTTHSLSLVKPFYEDTVRCADYLMMDELKSIINKRKSEVFPGDFPYQIKGDNSSRHTTIHVFCGDVLVAFDTKVCVSKGTVFYGRDFVKTKIEPIDGRNEKIPERTWKRHNDGTWYDSTSSNITLVRYIKP
ncbi:hypothetical protein AKO1_009592 [Acrasis kona]|uniref:Uncharacterized protein n=1 Tax=Acrasis kona TaxID=1008807 RepID=A0AAW2YPR8_9EUKA